MPYCRIGILSDTHDRLERTQRAISLLHSARVDVLIHCGDLTGPEIVTACSMLPAYFVFGNNDADQVPHLRERSAETGVVCLGWGDEIQLAQRRIAVVHGHMGTDVRRLLDRGPDYMLSGHSHVAGDWKEGSTRRINPGALHRSAEFTVAVLDLETDELEYLTVRR